MTREEKIKKLHSTMESEENLIEFARIVVNESGNGVELMLEAVVIDGVLKLDNKEQDKLIDIIERNEQKFGEIFDCNLNKEFSEEEISGAPVVFIHYRKDPEGVLINFNELALIDAYNGETNMEEIVHIVADIFKNVIDVALR